jgi:hypothetical protein
VASRRLVGICGEICPWWLTLCRPLHDPADGKEQLLIYPPTIGNADFKPPLRKHFYLAQIKILNYSRIMSHNCEVGRREWIFGAPSTTLLKQFEMP